jgi:hypothetical protein
MEVHVELLAYHGSCHCGAIKYSFNSRAISAGLRCNCSICRRKGALMSTFTIAPAQFDIDAEQDFLGSYQFGSCVAKHYFCKRCGIYTFHETRRKPGYYRVNLGCIDGLDALALASETVDGAALN